MSGITGWLRENSQAMADRLIDINTEQLLKDSVSGFGAKRKVIEVLDHLNAALFPGLYEYKLISDEYVSVRVSERLNRAAMLLRGVIYDIFINTCEKHERHSGGCSACQKHADDVTLAFMMSLPDIREILSTDIESAYLGDPASVSFEEILLSYPSLEAVSVYRMANKLFTLKVPFIPRIMTEHAHRLTGIDIHPGATIGNHFFIDHGTGVVFGETCIIGNNVKLYQGVTLGAKSFELDNSGNPVKGGLKRHPNIEDNVVIYSGATILGGDTTVGHDSIIGGNVWLIKSVPPHSKIYNGK